LELFLNYELPLVFLQLLIFVSFPNLKTRRRNL